MNILIINTSPRPEGTSAYIANEIRAGITDDNVEIINLRELDLKCCMACRACKNSDKLCVIKDDMQAVYRKLLNADKIVFITPNHFGFISSHAKIFTDRWYCLTSAGRVSKFDKGKKAVFIVTQASQSKDLANNIVNWGKHFFTNYGFAYYQIVLSGCAHDDLTIAKMKINEIKSSVLFF